MKKLLLIPFVILLFKSYIFAGEATGTLDTGVSSGIGGVVISSPIATPSSSTFSSTQSVILEAQGAPYICYTTDGNSPSCFWDNLTCLTGTKYTGTLTFSSTTTLKSVSCYQGSQYSSIATNIYTYQSSSGGGSSGGGGGGGGAGGGVTTDFCPNGDFSGSFNDNRCTMECSSYAICILGLDTQEASTKCGSRPVGCDVKKYQDEFLSDSYSSGITGTVNLTGNLDLPDVNYYLGQDDELDDDSSGINYNTYIYNSNQLNQANNQGYNDGIFFSPTTKQAILYLEEKIDEYDYETEEIRKMVELLKNYFFNEIDYINLVSIILNTNNYQDILVSFANMVNELQKFDSKLIGKSQLRGVINKFLILYSKYRTDLKSISTITNNVYLTGNKTEIFEPIFTSDLGKKLYVYLSKSFNKYMSSNKAFTIIELKELQKSFNNSALSMKLYFDVSKSKGKQYVKNYLTRLLNLIK